MFSSGILSYYCTLVTQHAKKATIHVLSNLVKLLDKAFLRDQDKKKAYTLNDFSDSVQ